MAISLRPISFHDSRMACDGLGAGFGGAFVAASCARAGSARNAAANAIPAKQNSFFISSSVALWWRRLSFETYGAARSVSAVRQILLRKWDAGTGKPVRKLRSPCQIVSPAAHGKLKVQAGRHFCECWLAVGPAGNRPRVVVAHHLFPIFLVPRTLAAHCELGQHGAARGGSSFLPRACDDIDACHCGCDAHGHQPLDSARKYFRIVRGHVVYVRVLRISGGPICARAGAGLAIAGEKKQGAEKCGACFYRTRA